MKYRVVSEFRHRATRETFRVEEKNFITGEWSRHGEYMRRTPSFANEEEAIGFVKSLIEADKKRSLHQSKVVYIA